MPKSKAYVSSDDSSSNSDEVRETKKRKQKKEPESSEEKSTASNKKPKKEEEDTVWDLGNNKQVTVREFKGKLYVDVREMYFDKDGDLKPGRKGISLNMVQWRKFMSIVEEVDRVAKSKC